VYSVAKKEKERDESALKEMLENKDKFREDQKEVHANNYRRFHVSNFKRKNSGSSVLDYIQNVRERVRRIRQSKPSKIVRVKPEIG
jgi:hypothetical protein